MGRYVIQLFDILGEGMQTSFKTAPLLADGSNFGAQATLAQAFEDAIIGVTDGEVGLSSLARETKSLVYPPVNVDGNSVLRDQWIAKYTDTTTLRTFSVRIPTAEEPNAVTQVLPDGSKIRALDLTTGVGLALKTAWDAFVYSEDGNATVLDMVYLRK